MVMNDTQQLLTEYARSGSEAAFAELVSNYINLVYSTAVRMLGEDAHLANDATQIVFVNLARKASTLSGNVQLGGWLHRHTCLVAANMRRSERRRRSREGKAVAMNTQEDHSEAKLAQVLPLLDEAINELGAADRTAILLRYFEQHDFSAVGAALGSSENAAQKRVARRWTNSAPSSSAGAWSSRRQCWGRFWRPAPRLRPPDWRPPFPARH